MIPDLTVFRVELLKIKNEFIGIVADLKKIGVTPFRFIICQWPYFSLPQFCFSARGFQSIPDITSCSIPEIYNKLVVMQIRCHSFPEKIFFFKVLNLKTYLLLSYR